MAFFYLGWQFNILGCNIKFDHIRVQRVYIRQGSLYAHIYLLRGWQLFGLFPMPHLHNGQGQVVVGYSGLVLCKYGWNLCIVGLYVIVCGVLFLCNRGGKLA